jgi:hypothetical protein
VGGVTSSDGGDEPAEGEPEHLSPPADPWLTEAPTSVLGDAASLQDRGVGAGEVPLADTARFDEASPMGAGGFDDPPSGWVPAPDQQRRGGRRAIRWVVAILAACALFIAGMLAIDQFGGEDGGDRNALEPAPSIAVTTRPTAGATTRAKHDATTAPTGGAITEPVVGAAPGSSSASSQPDPGAPMVVYEVTASGSDNTGSVSYTDQDGDIIRRNGIPLPWRTTFALDGRRLSLVLIAQRKGGGDTGPVTCTITVGGKELSSTTERGRYAAPECSGSA